MPVSEAVAAWAITGGLYGEPRLSALGISHGVTTRALGDMKYPENQRRALEAAGLPGKMPSFLKQEHGTKILDICAPAPGGAGLRPGDGWLCALPGPVPAIYAADCLPLFVWDKEKKAVGVFHAGWRGLAAGMPGAAVRAFRRCGLSPERLEAAVGPHVGACCYRVGPEVAAKFREEVRRDGRLDLGREAVLQFVESGIPEERVSASDACTSCRREEFFSYRRDKNDGRMMAFVAL